MEMETSTPWVILRIFSNEPTKQKMTMKTKNMLWAALSMTAALVMTACSNDDNVTETPQAPSTSKIIPYTVTVNDGATTRATVADDPSDATNYHKTLYFAAGDKLYITGTNIKGVLDLQAGDEGKASGATFSGNLTYSGEGSPADNLELTATLVSAQQTDGEEVTINATTGAVTVNYPTTAYCGSINDAVQKYSNLTGTSTYGARAFTLTQQTAFLNFVITFDDGTTTGTELTAVVNNNSSNICSASVTTETVSENVVAKFVLPVAAGTTLSSATVTMGDKEAISFGASQTLTGKVYNVKKTQAAAGPVTYTALSGGEVLHVGDIIEVPVGKEWYINTAYYFSRDYNPFTVVRANITGDEEEGLTVTEAADGAYYVIKDKDGNWYFTGEENRLPVTVTSDGIYVTSNGATFSGTPKYIFSVHEP